MYWEETEARRSGELLTQLGVLKLATKALSGKTQTKYSHKLERSRSLEGKSAKKSINVPAVA